MRARKASEPVLFSFSHLAPRLIFVPIPVLSRHQIHPNGPLISKTGAKVTEEKKKK